MIVGVCGLSGFWLSRNSIKDVQWLRSAASIEADLRRDLPVGTPRERVEAYFAVRRARLTSSSKQAGFVSRNGESVGSGHLDVTMGDYWLLFKTEVSATAGFDADGRLIALEVQKTKDTL